MDPFGGYYKLVGIGDFSHGINEIWMYRMQVIKQIIKNRFMPKIFIEDTSRGPNNIMSDNPIVVSHDAHNYDYRNEFPLMRYTDYRIYDSPIYYQFIRLIKKYDISIIGIDSDDEYRETQMANNILQKMSKNPKVINLFFGHNLHIDDREINYDPNSKYTTGHYLRKKLGNKYCIMLSCGLSGHIRFGDVDGNIMEVPIDKKYRTDIRLYKNIYDRNVHLHLYLPIKLKSNIVTINTNYPMIHETNWDYHKNWEKNNMYQPTNINYLIIFPITTSLLLFRYIGMASANPNVTLIIHVLPIGHSINSMGYLPPPIHSVYSITLSFTMCNPNRRVIGKVIAAICA